MRNDFLIHDFKQLSFEDMEQTLKAMQEAYEVEKEKEAIKQEFLNDIPFGIHQTISANLIVERNIDFIRDIIEGTGFSCHIDFNKIRFWHPKKSEELEKGKYYEFRINSAFEVLKSTIEDEKVIREVLDLLDPADLLCKRDLL